MTLLALGGVSPGSWGMRLCRQLVLVGNYSLGPEMAGASPGAAGGRWGPLTLLQR